MSAALLSVNDIALSYGAQTLLEGATFAVAAGEKIGLVGRNGCGKTSLLKILTEQQQPDRGTMARRRGLRVGFLPQEFELAMDKTVRQNIEDGASDIVDAIYRYENDDLSDAERSDIQHLIEVADGWNLDSRIKAQAQALRVPDMDALVGPLSGGEKRRVALCRALVSQPDLLLLDEPTNHLDAESISWLEGYLKSFPGAVIFVTHDRYFLDVIATRIIEIADGKCFAHPGNYTAYLEAKALRQEIASQTERRRQRFIRAELEYVRAGVRAQRSKSRNRLETFYQIAGLEAPPEEREMDLILPPPPPMGNIGIELEKVGARAGGEGRWLFRNLDLTLAPGTCTGVVGPNGAGKTTLLKICLGERDTEEGKATIGKRVVFNSIDQGRMHLNLKGTVIEEVADMGGETVTFGDTKLAVRAYLRRFLFTDERIRERVDRLSGGERARLLLAKALKRGGNMIVLDEPTNDLDLASLRILEEALTSFTGTSLVVSHDRYFLDRVCDQVIVFEEGGVYVQPGNYSYYLEKKKERDAAASGYTDPGPAASATTIRTGSTRVRKLTFKETRELETMEDTILAAENRAAEIDRLLNDPDFFVTRSAEAPALLKEQEKLKADITRLYSRWEELAAIAEG